MMLLPYTKHTLIQEAFFRTQYIRNDAAFAIRSIIVIMVSLHGTFVIMMLLPYAIISIHIHGAFIIPVTFVITTTYYMQFIHIHDAFMRRSNPYAFVRLRPTGAVACRCMLMTRT